jgi:hypothetical protein
LFCEFTESPEDPELMTSGCQDAATSGIGRAAMTATSNPESTVTVIHQPVYPDIGVY